MARVCVIGAGLAGLTAAVELSRAGVDVTVIDAADAPGGRVRTDEVDGFLIDRGFQVLLDAYPETERLLDYEALELRPFYPGALVRYDGAFHRIADPWRKPIDAARGFLSPIATLRDKAKLLPLGLSIKGAELDEIWRSGDRSTMELLHEAGLSEIAIQRFFKPFFGGVFFDRSLSTSERMFRFTFKMFATGRTVVPRGGMQRIPEQLASMLPAGSVRLSTAAERVERGRVTLASGETIDADGVVVATDAEAALRLLKGDEAAEATLRPHADRGFNSTYTFAFAAEEAPVGEPILLLDGDGVGPINHVAVMSNVSDAYAPAGGSLIYANTAEPPLLEGEALVHEVRNQMAEWFGDAAQHWRHVKTAHVARALPKSPPGTLALSLEGGLAPSGVALAGDYLHDPSINGAMASGRRAAGSIVHGLERG